MSPTEERVYCPSRPSSFSLCFTEDPVQQTRTNHMQKPFFLNWGPSKWCLPQYLFFKKSLLMRILIWRGLIFTLNKTHPETLITLSIRDCQCSFLISFHSPFSIAFKLHVFKAKPTTLNTPSAAAARSSHRTQVPSTALGKCAFTDLLVICKKPCGRSCWRPQAANQWKQVLYVPIIV